MFRFHFLFNLNLKLPASVGASEGRMALALVACGLWRRRGGGRRRPRRRRLNCGRKIRLVVLLLAKRGQRIPLRNGDWRLLRKSRPRADKDCQFLKYQTLFFHDN